MPLSHALRSALAGGVLAAASLASATAAGQEPTKQECVEANESAQDLQHSGKLVEARAQLATCAARACPHAVRQDCTDRLRAVESALPTVIFAMKDTGKSDTTPATFTVDGAGAAPVPAGNPIPLDPGPHTFTFSLEGRSPVSLRITLKEGDHVQREVVFKAAVARAEPAPAADGAPESPANGEAPAPAPAPGPSASGGHPSIARRVGWGALGAGTAGVVLGSIFGIVGLSKKSRLNSACLPDGSCKQASESDIDGLHYDAVASTVSFAVGILGLGAGTVLLVAFPDAPKVEVASAIRVQPWIGLGNAGMAGSFP
jgi:hypothetical protein